MEASAFEILRQFARKRNAAETCDLCSQFVADEHPHLVEPPTRKILCSCEACAVLFSDQANPKYKRVPRDSKHLVDFQLSDPDWDQLMIPIGMAFFFYSTPAQKVVALYPGPAGAIESLLRLEAWDSIVQQNPALAQMESDVQALLVNRVGKAREYYLVPIDQCYKLVGLIRTQWKGLSGGVDVWREINNFFEGLNERSIVLRHEGLNA